MSDEMLIRVKVEFDSPCEDYPDTILHQEVVTLHQLLDEVNEYDLVSLGFVKVKLSAGGKIDKANEVKKAKKLLQEAREL